MMPGKISPIARWLLLRSPNFSEGSRGARSLLRAERGCSRRCSKQASVRRISSRPREWRKSTTLARLKESPRQWWQAVPTTQPSIAQGTRASSSTLLDRSCAKRAARPIHNLSTKSSSVSWPPAPWFRRVERTTVLNEGDMAPDFRAATDDGRTVSLADFREQNLLLYFFPKANTPG